MGKTNIASATLLQTKLYLYTSYVVGGRLPKGSLPEALFWDTADPYHYIRVDRQPRSRLRDFRRRGSQDRAGSRHRGALPRARGEGAEPLFPALEVTHRWSGQVIETNDGLPFIGETSDRQFVATGFSGNGMTFGTLAAMMARDAVLGLENPWRELFDVGRTKIKGGVWDYIRENVDYPYYMIKDRFAGAEGKSLRELGAGEGKILELDGEKRRRLPRRRRQGDAAVAGLHAHGLHRRVEHARRRRGTARATARASGRTATCSRARRSRRSNRLPPRRRSSKSITCGCASRPSARSIARGGWCNPPSEVSNRVTPPVCAGCITSRTVRREFAACERAKDFGTSRPRAPRFAIGPRLGRIRSLVIPPAWRDVWICSNPRGHLQATGRDARGRKQHRYHPRWRRVRDEAKYGRMLDFAAALPALRRRVEADVSTPGLPRRKVVAAVVQLLEKTLIRIGNDEYARDNDSFGLTTMKNGHARISGSHDPVQVQGQVRKGS